MQIFVIDGVLQAASLLVHLPVLGQLLALLIQLCQPLLQLRNLSPTTESTEQARIGERDCKGYSSSSAYYLLCRS